MSRSSPLPADIAQAGGYRERHDRQKGGNHGAVILRPLFDRPGPWASVYLDASRDSENADHEVDLRWRMGVRGPVQVRADAALLRAMTGTDAALVLVDPGEGGPPHGIGAVLRYADASTRTS